MGIDFVDYNSMFSEVELAVLITGGDLLLLNERSRAFLIPLRVSFIVPS